MSVPAELTPQCNNGSLLVRIAEHGLTSFLNHPRVRVTDRADLFAIPVLVVSCGDHVISSRARDWIKFILRLANPLAESQVHLCRDPSSPQAP